MKVLISGASGMIGQVLARSMSAPKAWNGFKPQVLRLVRRPAAAPDEVAWNPYEGHMDAEKLQGVDAVVHLAGENVGSGDGLLAFTGRWTERKRHLIMESRRRGTRLLARTLAGMEQPPKVLVSASGIGFYGDRGDQVLHDGTSKGRGFLSDVAQVWEAETLPASDAGIRTVNMRFGAVLSSHGGALEKLIPPFELGMGSVMGSGEQFMSWISLADAVRAIEFAVHRTALAGPVNACSPNPVTNLEFSRALARSLHRPLFLSLPGSAVRAMLGDMGEETILASQRAVPDALLKHEFRFRHPTIDLALKSALSLSGGEDDVS